MISEILMIIYGLLLIFIIFIASRLLYFILISIHKKSKSYLGVIIEGSEDYWKWRWKNVHKSKKISYENIDEHHPIRGWTLIPNLKNKLHHAATINSTSNGVRGSEKENSKPKALFLGDSFCFGEGVDDDETIPSFFQKNFKDLQSINLGIHGYGIDQQYLYLKETISKYNPSLICFIICDNDFRRNFVNFRDAAKPRFDLKNNKVILKDTPIQTPEQCLRMKTPPLYHLFLDLAKHFLIYYGFIKKKEQIKINNYLLDNIKQLADKSNSKLFFIYIGDLRGGLLYKNYIQTYFINYFKKRNIPYIDLKQIWGGKKFVEMFDSLSGHLSAQGNKLAADRLAEIVKSQRE